MKDLYKAILLCVSLLASNMSLAKYNEDSIPEPFRGNDESSEYTIRYDDVDAMLDASVLVTGRSTRSKGKSSIANVGTRLKSSSNKLTDKEGNRFYFKAYKDEQQKENLKFIRDSLESLPSEVPLSAFSKKEQLAYWLNLYNVTLIGEIVKVYPEPKLKDFLYEDEEILSAKILNVAGVELSLNDIQYNILFNKFNGDPTIIYGLFQGMIGGPNVTNAAFKGKTVYSQLEDNANEFINSNRGVYVDSKKYARVSSLYRRNEVYFPEFKKDLKQHILKYLEGYTRYQFEETKKVKANINNWKIADLFGSERSFGASVNTNFAALLNSGSSAGGNEAIAGLDLVDQMALNNTVNYGRFTKEEYEALSQLRDKNLMHRGSVTVKDLDGTEEK